MDIMSIIKAVQAEGGTADDAKLAIMYAARHQGLKVQGMLSDEELASYFPANKQEQ